MLDLRRRMHRTQAVRKVCEDWSHCLTLRHMCGQSMSRLVGSPQIFPLFGCCMRGVFRRVLMTSLCLVYTFLWTAGAVLHRATCPHHRAKSSSRTEHSGAEQTCLRCWRHRSSEKTSKSEHSHNAPSEDQQHQSEHCGICLLFAQAVAPVEFGKLETVSKLWEPVVSARVALRCSSVLIDRVSRGPPGPARAIFS